MDSRKHGDFSLMKRGLKVAAKEATGGADDARLEWWAVREFVIEMRFGIAHIGFELGFKLEPRPKLLVTGLGLSRSPTQAC
ncbi:hypothetical protein AAG906_011497 [Vitis piasezkii]